MEVFDIIEEMEREILAFFESRRSFREVSPPADIYESRDLFIIRLEMPGLDRETLNVTLDGNKLIVRGSKKTFKGSEDVIFHQVEIDYSDYKKVFELPENIDRNRIRATYKDGHLYIALPKIHIPPEKKFKKISIERS